MQYKVPHRRKKLEICEWQNKVFSDEITARVF